MEHALPAAKQGAKFVSPLIHQNALPAIQAIILEGLIVTNAYHAFKVVNTVSMQPALNVIWDIIWSVLLALSAPAP
jgi:hypothetical protein